MTNCEMERILHDHRSTVLSSGDATQRINIRRSQLFGDALAAFTRPSFNPACHLKVRFIGEPAVDEGGPMREFFRLFTQSLSMAGSFFQTSPRGILPAHNILALGKNSYKTAGMILSVGVVHGAQSPMCFTPETAHFLVYGSITKMSEKEMLDGIPDAEIQDKLQKVCLV